MVRVALLSLFILAGGCGEEPGFDTRYEEAEQAIEEKAEAMDAELAQEMQPEGEPEPQAR